MSKNQDIAKLYGQFVIPTYSPALALVRGRGTKVWDADGKTYLDFIAGIAVHPVGHCHPRVVEAIRRQAGELIHCSNLYYNENQVLLAEKLSTRSMGGKSFFCNSGAEANEGLIKLARLWGSEAGRYEVITMRNSFHGRTLATAAATGQEKIQKGFEPMPAGFTHAEYNDLDSVAAKVGESTVAVLVEALQGEGGVVPATDEFLVGLRTLCNEQNLLLLCDEVQCGMGRTGAWFAFQHAGIEPDAFSLAKGLGSGYPVGAVVAAPEISDVFQPGKHASTFGGSPLACAAALETIRVIEDEHLIERAQKSGELFRAGLEAFVGGPVLEVRGKGLMLGMVLDRPAKPLTDLLAEQGLLALATAGNVVRFLPPLNIKDSELEEGLDILGDSLEQWQAGGPAEESAEASAEPESDDAGNAAGGE